MHHVLPASPIFRACMVYMPRRLMLPFHAVTWIIKYSRQLLFQASVSHLSSVVFLIHPSATPPHCPQHKTLSPQAKYFHTGRVRFTATCTTVWWLHWTNCDTNQSATLSHLMCNSHFLCSERAHQVITIPPTAHLYLSSFYFSRFSAWKEKRYRDETALIS